MYIGEDKRRDVDPCFTDDIPFTRIGISNQRRKKYTSSSASTVIPWVPIQFKRNDDTGSTGKDTKTEHTNKTTIERQQTEIMPVDSEPYWEGHGDDTCNWRSHSICAIPSTGLSKITTTVAQQLGITMQDHIQELKWWLNRESIKNVLPIRRPLLVPDLTIYVDASDSGWGVSSTSVQTAEFWTRFEKEESINVRELKSILFALQLHMPRYKNCNLKIYSDNRTALKYINKAEGTASEALQELAIRIQQLCNRYKVQLICHHVPGIQNTEADRLSRRSVPLYE
ncbi:hypothetical protein RMATCC62417_06464 [Rhizopus microsporus]|nr:hypothetical protein RMATCC62417_06464 [Rhizopus microsporus]